MNMRKVIWMALMIWLCALGAAAQEVPISNIARAAAPFDPAALAHLPGYAMDEESGAWRAGAPAAEALLDGLGRTSLERACLLQLEYQGDARTGRIQPVLRLDVLGSELKCGAVSILVDGVRYDLPVTRERADVGSRKVDRLIAPLPQEGLSLLDALRAAKQVELRLHGERTYTTQIDMRYAGTDAKKKLESGAARCLDVPGAPDMAAYALWDLNAAAWEGAHDFIPRIEKAPFEGKLSGMVSPGSSGSRVKELERALIAAGYMSGSADTTFAERTREAIQRAQRAYGLIESGSGDARLLALLETPAQPAPEREAASPEWLSLGDVRVALNRQWFARAAMPARATGAQDGFAARNQDNLLWIADGLIENLGTQTLRPDWSVQGTLTLDGRAYDCRILIERDGGAAFGKELIALGASRLIVAAEIPPAAQGLSGTLRLTMNAQTLEFSVPG